MKTKLNQLVFALSVLAVVALAPAIVKADPVLFNLQDSVMVSAGGSATLTGSISNGGPPRVWLTSWTFTFSNPLLTANDAALVSGLPLFLDSMQSYGPAAFFDVVAGAGLAPGLYTGSISIFGGDNEGDENIEYTQRFDINVVGGQNPIPEPTTMLLLGSGLAGAAALRRRRRQAKP